MSLRDVIQLFRDRYAELNRGATLTRSKSPYPNTFKPWALADGFAASFRVPRSPIFDPALRHFSRAYRLGDPQFTDPAVALRWQTARRAAVRHVLRVICRSPFAEHLVLRGSTLLRTWFGEVAREPRDLDWVVRGVDKRRADDFADDLYKGITRLVCEHALVADRDGAGQLVTFNAFGAATDDIWAYDRTPGRRILLPWRVGELPPGAVQLDFVFGESLHAPPVRRTLPGDARHPAAATLWAADMAQSLAWKLQWLATDEYPQGKDLYDATLLAEHVRLPASPLREVVASSPEPDALRRLTREELLNVPVYWDEFRQEYPWVDGSAGDWLKRLADALEPTLKELEANV
jgi:hypothetical protein